MWQRRFYDFNVRTARKRIEKLRYIHRNPVVRGLVQGPEQWPWSSYRSYAFGEEGAVRINQWSEVKIKIPTPGNMSPHLYKKRKGGPATGKGGWRESKGSTLAPFILLARGKSLTTHPSLHIGFRFHDRLLSLKRSSNRQTKAG